MESALTAGSVKRSASDDVSLPSAKRLKPTNTITRHHRISVKQPNAALLHYGPQDAGLVEEQLRRSVCIALYAAGFDSAQADAVEGLLAATEEYMVKFLRIVARSMQACRRTRPLPQDFTKALAQLNLRSSELEADLSLAIPAEATQLPLLPPTMPPVPAQYAPANAFDSQESRATTEKFARSYVPKHFPSFPSEHTFHATPVFTAREADARKVREQATQEGTEAEKALRKLMAASKAAASSRRRIVGGDAQRQEREEIWRETLEAVQAEDEKTRIASQQDHAMFGMDGARDMPDDMTSIEVNYDKLFGRRDR